MTDMKHIADLPPCERRWLMQNPNGVQIWCRAPTRPRTVTDAQAIKEPTKWFGKRQVTCETCRGCMEQEPVKAPQPSFQVNTVGHPVGDQMPFPEPTGPSPGPPKILGDGTIIYQKVGWEPPPVPVGYRRLSDDLKSPDAWTLVRKEPLCKHCELKRIKRPSCDCMRVLPTCTFHGKSENIELDQCITCQNYC